MQDGLAAAKLADYPLAIRYFEDARKTAPDAPELYFNLGLAEAKIPGRELRAVAWFGAFLAAVPDHPNASAIRQEVSSLDVRVLSTLTKLIKLVHDTGEKIFPLAAVEGRSAKDHEALKIAYRAERLLDITRLWVMLGDLENARKAATAIRGVDGHDKLYRGFAVFEIIQAQTGAGDFAGATKTLGLAQLAIDRSSGLRLIGEAQAAAGDLGAARQTLTEAAKAADAIDREPVQLLQASWWLKSQHQAQIAAAQAEIGDLEGATRTVRRIENDPRSAEARAEALAALARGHAKAKDRVQAEKIISESLQAIAQIKDDPTGIGDASAKVALAQAQLGDAAAAGQTVAAIHAAVAAAKDDWSKNRLQHLAQEAQAGIEATLTGASAKPGPLAVSPKSADWLARLDDDDTKHDCALRDRVFLDLPDYLKSIPADDISSYYGASFSAAWKLVVARKKIRAMLNASVGH